MKFYSAFYSYLHVFAFCLLTGFVINAHVFDCDYIDPYERYEMATRHDHTEFKPDFAQWMAEQEEKEQRFHEWVKNLGKETLQAWGNAWDSMTGQDMIQSVYGISEDMRYDP